MNDKFTAGKLKIAKSCVNTITCLKMLTGRDGQKGACKDMVDLVRYAVMSDIWGWKGAASRLSKTGGTRGTGETGAGADGNTSRPPRDGSRPRKSRIWW